MRENEIRVSQLNQIQQFIFVPVGYAPTVENSD